jgi:hypothetical protein
LTNFQPVLAELYCKQFLINFQSSKHVQTFSSSWPIFTCFWPFWKNIHQFLTSFANLWPVFKHFAPFETKFLYFWLLSKPFLIILTVYGQFSTLFLRCFQPVFNHVQNDFHHFNKRLTLSSSFCPLLPVSDQLSTVFRPLPIIFYFFDHFWLIFTIFDPFSTSFWTFFDHLFLTSFWQIFYQFQRFLTTSDQFNQFSKFSTSFRSFLTTFEYFW